MSTIEVVILSALSTELRELESNLNLTWSDYSSASSPCLNRFQTATLSFIHRESNQDRQITIAKASSREMGLTDAAILASMAILKFSPKLLVMIGICAGIKEKDIHIGDILIPKQSFHYQFGKIQESQENNQVFRQQMKVAKAGTELHQRIDQFLRNQGLAQIDNIIANRGLTKQKVPNVDNLFYPLKYSTDSMASSDFVVDSSFFLEQPQGNDRKLVGIDMESYAVLEAAEQLNFKNVLIIKSVRDFAANKIKDENYTPLAVLTSTQAFYLFTKYLVEETDFFFES